MISLLYPSLPGGSRFRKIETWISSRPIEPSYQWSKWHKRIFKSMIWVFFCFAGFMVTTMILNYISFGHWDWGLEKEIEILKRFF